MHRLFRLLQIFAHPAALRLALSGLAVRLGGDEAMGSLTGEELAALVRWVPQGCRFIEIGTLFGLTAKTVAARTGAQVTAVDNFCWNPFGLTPKQHETFTRQILADTDVELVNADALDYLETLSDDAFVFLDGDHRYEAVKSELETLRRRGVRYVAGHDFGNSAFGVTQAVRDVLGDPDEVVGTCWRWGRLSELQLALTAKHKK